MAVDRTNRQAGLFRYQSGSGAELGRPREISGSERALSQKWFCFFEKRYAGKVANLKTLYYDHENRNSRRLCGGPVEGVAILDGKGWFCRERTHGAALGQVRFVP